MLIINCSILTKFNKYPIRFIQNELISCLKEFNKALDFKNIINLTNTQNTFTSNESHRPSINRYCSMCFLKEPYQSPRSQPKHGKSCLSKFIKKYHFYVL